MSEIDRVSPIVRPVFGPRAADRVQPGSDRRHLREDHKDEPDQPSPEQPETPESHEEPQNLAPEHGLDLSI